MLAVLHSLQWFVLLPAIAGSIYAVLCSATAIKLLGFRARRPRDPISSWPAVTVLKPVCGLEKNQYENLRSACVQDYPEYQVVFSVQAPGDPAVPLLRRLEQEFGRRVTVAVESFRAGSNGKINNLIGGLRHARHEVLVISDSDVRLEPGYLKTIVAPLLAQKVACVCTLYKAACAAKWFEKLELLTLNADFMPNAIFAETTGASKFCLGASMALHRKTLEDIGGLESLADYLVEDYEMGRRIWSSGREMRILPYFVETIVDLKSPRQWWDHQLYWDQNHRSARPVGYFATLIIRSTPFAFFYALLRPDLMGLAVLGGAVAVRLATAAFNLGWALRDREGLKSIGLLFFRDMVSLLSWFLAFTKRTTVWRGAEYVLTRDGRLIAREARP